MEDTVLITGGSRGLGRELILRFLEEGWNVAACARHLGDLAEKCKGPRALLREVDIRDERQVQTFVGEAYTHFGGITALINNASILGPRTEIASYSPDQWRDVMDINLNGTFLLTQAVLPFMQQVRQGVILNISSSAGIKGSARWGAYAASKFAIEGFSQVLHEELSGSGVRVHVLDPGKMQTAMRAAAYPDENPATLPEPADVAKIVFDIVAVYEPKLLRLKSSDYL